MKKIVGLLLLSLMITGCDGETVDQTEKGEYLAWKSELVETEEFIDNDELNCDIAVSVDRVNDEVVSYTTVVSNPREDMKSVKMMVVHNYFTEDIFPTIGIFDKGRDLIVNDEDKLTLVGYIDTTKDIKKLDLELKIWMEYTDIDGNIKDIYYKTTK